MKKMLGLIVGFIIAIAPLAAFGAPFQDFKDNTNTSKMSMSEGGLGMSIYLKNNVAGQGFQMGDLYLGGSNPNYNGTMYIRKTDDTDLGSFGYDFMGGKVKFSLNDNSGNPVITMDKDIGINVAGTSVTANAFFGDGSGLTGLSGVSGSGTQNKVAKFTGATSIGDSLITDDNNSVTIQALSAMAGGSVNLYAGDAAMMNAGDVDLRGGAANNDTGFVQVTPSRAAYNGQPLILVGAVPAATLHTLACPSGHACMAYNLNDYDLYTTTGTSAGDWRNTRTGIGP